jgi:hypothetical protein
VQIGEVEREIKMRKEVYDRQVARGKMKHADAITKVAIMAAVLNTLKACRELELGLQKAFDGPIEKMPRW